MTAHELCAGDLNCKEKTPSARFLLAKVPGMSYAGVCRATVFGALAVGSARKIAG